LSRKRKVAQVKWSAPLLMGYSEELTLNARTWGVFSGLALLAHLLFGPAEKRRDLRNRHSARERVGQKEPVRVRPRFGRPVLCPVHHARLSSLARSF